jgi:hypothetical protein
MRTAPRITINESGSLLTFEYTGRITAAGIQEHCDEICALASRVKPPFAALVDLTDLEQMDPDCAPIISEIMERLDQMGLARVVRVIPDPRKDIGLGILSVFHYKSAIKINTVTSRSEAGRLIE